MRKGEAARLPFFFARYIGRMTSLGDRYLAVRRVTEELCRPLSAEDCGVQSMPDASPTKWHLAHTSWFFETFVLEGRPAYRPFHPSFRALFNSYYNAVVGERPTRSSRGLLSRPSLDEVLAYRRHVDEGMSRCLLDDDAPARATPLVVLGLNHEQQHQELILTDIKHAFWMNPLRPAYAPALAGAETSPPIPEGPAPPTGWCQRPGGLVEIGAADAGDAGEPFAFDNESPRHGTLLRPHALASRLVTCGEFQAFVADGGYRRPELWLSDGWEACQAGGWDAPLYWESRAGVWWALTFSGMEVVTPAEPVSHISGYEADAYARWAGARLPTEAEWEAAATSSAIADDARRAGNLLETGRLRPRAAAAPRAEATLTQLFGDVWEWTQSPYTPYPGFRPAAGAIGEYNGKFMSNQIVLRGGSCLTPGSHLRATYRNFFPPATRWQMAGLRLARDI
jgi:ergothioneine biosynthesis protein EgtB